MNTVPVETVLTSLRSVNYFASLFFFLLIALFSDIDYRLVLSKGLQTVLYLLSLSLSPCCKAFVKGVNTLTELLPFLKHFI